MRHFDRAQDRHRERSIRLLNRDVGSADKFYPLTKKSIKRDGAHGPAI